MVYPLVLRQSREGQLAGKLTARSDPGSKILGDIARQLHGSGSSHRGVAREAPLQKALASGAIPGHLEGGLQALDFVDDRINLLL
jgi:hypothetical protein